MRNVIGLLIGVMIPIVFPMFLQKYAHPGNWLYWWAHEVSENIHFAICVVSLGVAAAIVALTLHYFDYFFPSSMGSVYALLVVAAILGIIGILECMLWIWK